MDVNLNPTNPDGTKNVVIGVWADLPGRENTGFMGGLNKTLPEDVEYSNYAWHAILADCSASMDLHSYLKK